MVRTGAYVGIELVSVARKAFRAATYISQYATSVQRNLLWTNGF